MVSGLEKRFRVLLPTKNAKRISGPETLAGEARAVIPPGHPDP